MRFLTFSGACMVSAAAAQSIMRDNSFGLDNRLSPNGLGIPHWHVSGQGQVPQILSDKVILTPAYPGSTRGALWSETAVDQATWTAKIEFRATGPDKGSGNLQLWYIKDGREKVTTSSVYTVGTFEGLVLTIDQYSGKAGTIRGFMNEGNLDFKSHHSVDSLAFGHCDYAYRNIGKHSELQIQQSSNGFEVRIDDKLCFGSDKIQMPRGYFFGLTAGSGEPPDSFEIKKFQLSTNDPNTAPPPAVPPASQPPPVQQPPDTQASAYKSSEAQFEDLHNRLQMLAHAIDRIDTTMAMIQRGTEQRHNELLRNQISPHDVHRLVESTDKIDRLEKSLESASNQLIRLESSLFDSHHSISEVLPRHIRETITSHGPRIWPLVAMFVVIQIGLTGLYVVLKRRSKQGPKKYL